MSGLLNNVKYWRDRAEATRTIADGFRIAETQKKKLMKVAEEYERLADRAAQWRTADQVEEQR